MKKSLLFLTLPILALTACNPENSKENTQKTTLYVFAAASMTETLQSIEKKYEAVNKNIDLKFNFESSGTLKDQITAGSKCDIFISAAQKQMNALEEQNLINTETRFNMLENKISLVVPNGNPKNVTSFAVLKDKLAAHTSGFVLAMGDDDVPVGDYTKKILYDYYGLNKTDLETAGMISYGTNVKEVVTQVAQSSVSCGVVYSTDAFSGHLTVVDNATSEMCGQVIYPAAVTKNSKETKKAKAFLEYLKGKEASKIFEDVGFVALEK